MNSLNYFKLVKHCYINKVKILKLNKTIYTSSFKIMYNKFLFRNNFLRSITLKNKY